MAYHGDLVADDRLGTGRVEQERRGRFEAQSQLALMTGTVDAHGQLGFGPGAALRAYASHADGDRRDTPVSGWFGDARAEMLHVSQVVSR